MYTLVINLIGGNILRKIEKESVFISYRNNILYEVSEEFIELTGYTLKVIEGMSFKNLLRLLKINPVTSSKSNEDKEQIYKGYIFTNKDQPKHIEITCKKQNNEKKYIFKESESGFLNGVLATCIDNNINDTEAIAIYSYPELVHLKVNSNYLKKQKSFRLDTSELIGSVYKPYNPNISSDIEKEGHFYRQEKQLIDKEGNISYWTIKSNLIYEKGIAKYLKNTFIDETEKVLTRNKLKVHTREMEVILDNIPDSIVKLDKQGNYTYQNKAAKEGIDAYVSKNSFSNMEEFLGSFKYNDVNGRELSFDEIPSSKVLRGKEVDNYVIIETNDLATIYHKCIGIPIYDDHGDVESAVIIYRDIKDTLKFSEYTALANDMQHLEVNYATLSAKDLKINYINNNIFESTKKRRPNIKSKLQIIGHDFFDFYYVDPKDKDEFLSNIEDIVRGKSSKYVYKERILVGGKIDYVKTIFQPIFNENKEIENISCLGMYITDEELANQQMAESLKAQEEIFTNTSHELKTPINLIFSACQLLDFYLNTEDIKNRRDKVKHNNQIIKQNCYRTIKLINNILDVSKMEKGFYELSLENKDIVKVVDKIVMSVADYIKDKHISIIFDPKVEEKIIALDLYKFERIMLNLISNAIKFSENEGVIFIDLIGKEGFVEISVKDQGIGIEQENINLIFNKFKQENKSLNRNTEGTGIGLSLVKTIVELHGGSIDVESTVNVGSKFTVSLPCKILNEPLSSYDEYLDEDRIEMIRFELSDIYS